MLPPASSEPPALPAVALTVNSAQDGPALLHAACRRMYDAAWCILHVAHACVRCMFACTFRVARFVSHASCCTLHAGWLYVAWSVARCMLDGYTLHGLLHVARGGTACWFWLALTLLPVSQAFKAELGQHLGTRLGIGCRAVCTVCVCVSVCVHASVHMPVPGGTCPRAPAFALFLCVRASASARGATDGGTGRAGCCGCGRHGDDHADTYAILLRAHAHAQVARRRSLSAWARSRWDSHQPKPQRANPTDDDNSTGNAKHNIHAIHAPTRALQPGSPP
jgi:hypothetical protein